MKQFIEFLKDVDNILNKLEKQEVFYRKNYNRNEFKMTNVRVKRYRKKKETKMRKK